MKKGSFTCLFVCLALAAFSYPAGADDYLVTQKSKIGSLVEMTVQYNDLDRTKISYEIDGFNKNAVRIDNKAYNLLSIPSTAWMDFDQAGHPMIPELSASLMVPDTALMEVSVFKCLSYDIDNFNLAPWRGNIPRSVDPSTVPYELGEEYEMDAWYPAEITRLRDPFVLHDVRGIVLEVHPFQYNPVKNVLRVYTHIEVEVTNVGLDTVNVIDRGVYGYRPDIDFENVYKSVFSNYASNRGSRGLPSESGEMLVISHGAFMPNVQPLVDWKNSIGIKTTMVDVATIGNNAANIKNYIKAFYQKYNLAYVLIVGDHAQVKSPISYSAQDPTYTLMDGDNHPDIFLGRMSAENTDHVDTQVERALDYEQVGHDVVFGGWDAKSMGVASDEGLGAGIYGLGDWQHEGLIRDALLVCGYTLVDEIYEPWATKAMITAGVHDGRKMINYTGHGGPTGWGTTGYSNNDVYKLQNTVALPVINSVACNTGQFHNYTCFAEAWTRHTYNGKPSGGLIFQGSTIGMSWAPPMYGQCNHCVGGKYGFVDNLYMENFKTYGGCFYAGMITMMQLAGSSGVNEFEHWTYFGDPSLHIAGAPGTMTLHVDGWRVPIDQPVELPFNIRLGSGCADYDYAILGGVTGTSPGTVLPGGAVLPLNWDAFTTWMLGYLNTPPFLNFIGTLDGDGNGIGTFSTVGMTPLDPRVDGTRLLFAAAACTKGPIFVATNPEMIAFVEEMPQP